MHEYGHENERKRDEYLPSKETPEDLGRKKEALERK